jgi:hypothetical protein
VFASCKDGAVQVAAMGAPMQVKAALPANPTPAVTRRLKFAVCPAEMVTVVPPDVAGARVRAGFTLAAIEMICGESGASSVIVREADRWPREGARKPQLWCRQYSPRKRQHYIR